MVCRASEVLVGGRCAGLMSRAGMGALPKLPRNRVGVFSQVKDVQQKPVTTEPEAIGGHSRGDYHLAEGFEQPGELSRIEMLERVFEALMP